MFVHLSVKSGLQLLADRVLVVPHANNVLIAKLVHVSLGELTLVYGGYHDSLSGV